MPDQLSQASKAAHIKVESDDEQETTSSGVKREGNTEEEAIDVDDLPDMIDLEESKLRCPENGVFEAVRKRYVVALKQIVKTVNPTINLKGRLEDAASFAETADPATLINRHKSIWSLYMRSAVREAKVEVDEKSKMFEKLDNFERSSETEIFEKSILKPSRKRLGKIEANQEMTNGLVADLKKYLKDHAPRR